MTSLGKTVAQLRARRGMSQRELASAVSRSESWVSQVERDVIPVDRIPVLQSLADALDVALHDLRPDHDEDAAPVGEQPPSDMDSLRLAMTGHPAPALLLADGGKTTETKDDLAEQVAQAWDAAHAGRYADVNAILVQILPRLETARRAAPVKGRPAIAALTAEAYQVAAAAFSRLDEADAAWIAADRSMFIAEEAGQPLTALAGMFRMAHAFITLQRLDQAEQVARTGIAALQDHADDEPSRSVLGALNLVLAVAYSKAGQRDQAHEALNQARELGQQLGADRNDYGTEFGPTNVALHAVAVSVELGDAGAALEIAKAVDLTPLSAERQSRFWIDVARAHAQRRHNGEATQALLKAEVLAPEQVHTHALTRQLVRELVAVSGRRPPEELTALASRCAAS